MTVLAIIPARYASTRFPGKPLVLIDGKPMIQRVWEQVCQAKMIDRVIVATDDERIAQVVKAFGGEVCMTSAEHPSGTDRIWEVAEDLKDYELIMNVQGDEPFLNPASLDQAVVEMRQQPQADIMTLVCPIDLMTDEGLAHYHDPNVVKAVRGLNGQIFYFSRSPVPHFRDGLAMPADKGNHLTYRHIGLYLFRRDALERFTMLPPSPLECAEKLEQLRALENGMTLYAVVIDEAPVGIDTPRDLERLVCRPPL